MMAQTTRMQRWTAAMLTINAGTPTEVSRTAFEGPFTKGSHIEIFLWTIVGNFAGATSRDCTVELFRLNVPNAGQLLGTTTGSAISNGRYIMTKTTAVVRPAFWKPHESFLIQATSADSTCDVLVNGILIYHA